MKIYILIISLSCVLVSPFVNATQVDDLYVVELPISDQTTTSRLQVFRSAFRKVIVKVSGNDDALKSQAFKRPQQLSARYVKQFRYINRKSEDEFDAGQLFLRVDFNQRLIESLLRENGFPVWGRERPSSLLLISYDVNEVVDVVSGDSTPELMELMDQSAQALGLPVLFPLMDLEDRALISSEVITNKAYDTLGRVAVRYLPDALLIGQIIGRNAKGWQGLWETRLGDQVFRWQHTAKSRTEVIDQALSQLGGILAREYALLTQRQFEQAILMRVSQIYDVKGFVAVQKYLQSLDAIKSVLVSHVSATSITYQLNLRNQPEELQRLIELGQVLEQQGLPQAVTNEQALATLDYIYDPN